MLQSSDPTGKSAFISPKPIVTRGNSVAHSLVTLDNFVLIA